MADSVGKVQTVEATQPEPNLTDIQEDATMGDKSVETLGSKIRFLSVLVTFAPFPKKQC